MTKKTSALRLAAPAIRHLLVDLDGTLLGNRSLSLSLDFVGRAIGTLKMYGSWRVIARTLLAIQREFQTPTGDMPNDMRIVELFAQRMKLPLDEARKVLREGVSAVFPPLQKHFYPMEGAKDFLDWAKDRYSLTLATNPVWPSEIIKLRVEWAGIDPSMFSFITDVRTMRACKPSEKYYEQILVERGFDRHETLLIGNDVKMDLPACKVGIRVFIVGRYERIEPIPHAAAAWKGTFAHLRGLLSEG